jgi:hypothetical protein
MYSLINFENQVLYEIVDTNHILQPLLPKLSEKTIIVTEDFLEDYFTLARLTDIKFYPFLWLPEHATNGTRAVNDLKEHQFFILIDNKWEVCAKLKKVTPQYFLFRVAEGHEIYTTTFKQGDMFEA